MTLKSGRSWASRRAGRGTSATCTVVFPRAGMPPPALERCAQSVESHPAWASGAKVSLQPRSGQKSPARVGILCSWECAACVTHLFGIFHDNPQASARNSPIGRGPAQEPAARVDSEQVRGGHVSCEAVTRPY